MDNKAKNTVVSVLMVTYAHEQFIAQAIESIVIQETNFVFELVIGEDYGPDKTREICLSYQQKYPDIIKLNFQDKNVGPQQNFINTYKCCKGKYIALCEGDDYWTDKHKLQKQVDFLETNPTYTMCAHASDILTDGIFESMTLDKDTLTIDDILAENWGIMTASVMFRKNAFNIPDWFVKVKNGDFALQLLMSDKGKIGYLSDNMSVYRRHIGGISSRSLTPFNQAAWVIYLLYEFNRYSAGKYKKLINKRIQKTFNNQIGFAKEYNLRRTIVKLRFYQLLSPIAPFLIKNSRI